MIIGNTPLRIAKSSDVKNILIAHGAYHLEDWKKAIESWEVDKIGKTPLHIASENGKLEVVVALLEAGADPNTRDINLRDKPIDVVVKLLPQVAEREKYLSILEAMLPYLPIRYTIRYKYLRWLYSPNTKVKVY